MRACLALWVFFLISVPALGQFPPPFTRFSDTDVLRQVFPTYDHKIGRQFEFLNQEQYPARAKVLEAKPWTAGGKKYLVVFALIAADDTAYDNLCGNCATYGLLAVLREERGRLSLVARQEAGPYLHASNPEDGELSGPTEALWFSGHDSVSLDLAPYRLTRDETLIGVRTEHMWLPAMDWETHLQLFRIVGSTLKPAFEGPVIERAYQGSFAVNGPVEKTTAILSSQPAGRFHDLVIDRTTFRCPVDDNFDCDSKNMTKIRQKRERWMFDGEKYVLKSPERAESE